MFQFPGCPSVRLWIHLTMTGHYSSRVSPFGYLRINACLRLLVAFRSLPRPSSAYGALASTLCSYSLDFYVDSPKTNLISPPVNLFTGLNRNDLIFLDLVLLDTVVKVRRTLVQARWLPTNPENDTEQKRKRNSL